VHIIRCSPGQPFDECSYKFQMLGIYNVIGFHNDCIGVFRGHYRTDSLGANLNRYYLDPDRTLHPSIYAAKSLLLYYHQQYGVQSLLDSHSSQSHSLASPASSSQVVSECSQSQSPTEIVSTNLSEVVKLSRSAITLAYMESGSSSSSSSILSSNFSQHPSPLSCDDEDINLSSPETTSAGRTEHTTEVNASEESSEPYDHIEATKNSGIALYVDLHAHAAKRGVFIYGNYFKKVEYQTENMLIPKLVSLNSPHLDFEHCVFSEKNMYAMDKKTGLSKEGSGRVGMHKATGIIPW